MEKWLLDQFYHLNIISLIVIGVFVVALGKSNTTKMLKEQSQELYNEFEELKDEIRGNRR